MKRVLKYLILVISLMCGIISTSCSNSSQEKANKETIKELEEKKKEVAELEKELSQKKKEEELAQREAELSKKDEELKKYEEELKKKEEVTVAEEQEPTHTWVRDKFGAIDAIGANDYNAWKDAGFPEYGVVVVNAINQKAVDPNMQGPVEFPISIEAYDEAYLYDVNGEWPVRWPLLSGSYNIDVGVSSANTHVRFSHYANDGKPVFLYNCQEDVFGYNTFE